MVRVGFEALDVIVRLPLALPADDGVNETLKVMLCPAVSVTGVVIPLKLNPEPLIPTDEIVTVVPPVFVTVSDRVCLFPTVTVPKLRLVGLAPSVPGVTPLPDKGMVRLGFEALDVIVRLPLAPPADDGVNETLKVALCPAVNVTGVVIPLKLNPEPLIPTEEIVTVVPPLLVTVSDRDCLFPTVTLPKLRLVGFAPSVPGVTPLPDKGMVRVGFEALDVIVRLPLALPADEGVNETLKVALCPAVSVTGVVIPVKLNPEALTATEEIVTVVPPVFVTVSDTDFLFPTVTLPKLMLLGSAPRPPGETPVPDSGMVSVGFEALDVRVTLPLALPAEDGLNKTVKFALCPAVSVRGAVIPLSVNPPLTVI
jgi:hypothetical protein